MMKMSTIRRAFEGKVALITGAASGIGRELAEQLHAAGARLALTDIDGGAVTELAGRLGAEGYQHDVRDLARWEAIVADVGTKHGAVDVLFNNAGVTQIAAAETLTIDDWRRVLGVNVDGVVHGVHCVYPGMVERGRGHIVNTASIAGLYPAAGQVPYTTSKFAVVGLSHALRAEAARHGVKVTAVCPGIIETAMRRELPIKGASAEQLRGMLPTGLPVDECVRQILRGVARNDATIVITPLARVLAGVSRMAPGLGHWLNRTSFAMLTERLQPS